MLSIVVRSISAATYNDRTTLFIDREDKFTISSATYFTPVDEESNLNAQLHTALPENTHFELSENLRHKPVLKKDETICWKDYASWIWDDGRSHALLYFCDWSNPGVAGFSFNLSHRPCACCAESHGQAIRVISATGYSYLTKHARCYSIKCVA